jgi:hypothetical protein
MLATPEISFGSFRLLPSQHLLLEGDKPVALGSRAMDILLALVERPGVLVLSILPTLLFIFLRFVVSSRTGATEIDSSSISLDAVIALLHPLPRAKRLSHHPQNQN